MAIPHWNRPGPPCAAISPRRMAISANCCAGMVTAAQKSQKRLFLDPGLIQRLLGNRALAWSVLYDDRGTVSYPTPVVYKIRDRCLLSSFALCVFRKCARGHGTF